MPVTAQTSCYREYLRRDTFPMLHTWILLSGLPLSSFRSCIKMSKVILSFGRRCRTTDWSSWTAALPTELQLPPYLCRQNSKEFTYFRLHISYWDVKTKCKKYHSGLQIIQKSSQNSQQVGFSLPNYYTAFLADL